MLLTEPNETSRIPAYPVHTRDFLRETGRMEEAARLCNAR